MADQIIDNRTLVDSAEVLLDYVGSTSPALDDEIFIQGAGSIADQMNNSLRYILFNAGSTQDWSNNVFYVWINCGIVGLLKTRATGGFSIRFAGVLPTDFFEFFVGGNDSWPSAVAGGWVQFVVDIEGTPDNTGGTPPATTAIQHVGFSAETITMTRSADNTWLDEIRRLPDGTPGIIVEGRNPVGPADWTFDDIVTELGQNTGTAKDGAGGSIILSTSIQFGINDTSTHGFTDTNKVILWEDQTTIPADLYKISALGNVGGTTNVTMGVKTGTGADATGAQGITFSAAAASVRWDIDFNDPNLDSVNMYGCQLIHGGAMLLDDAAVSLISTSYIDCTSALVSGSEQLRISVINANTADDVAFMTTNDLDIIKNSTFEFSDGHAIAMTVTSGGETFTGNKFTGYGVDDSTDAAIYNTSGGSLVINVGGGGDTPTVKLLSNTTVNNNVTITFTGMRDDTEVRIYKTSDNAVVGGIENATAGTADDRSFAWTAAASLSVYYVIHNETYESIRVEGYTVPTTDTSLPIQQRFDRNFSNP